jgi:hypothetical protein
MTALWGSLLWGIAGLALWRVHRRGTGWMPRGFRGRIALAVGTAAAAVLLFRPHEEIFGGEDAGAYLNVAAHFARGGGFRQVDPLLAAIPPEVRRDFLYYGHHTVNRTQDACLWIKDLASAREGLYFQPAPSLLMAMPGRWFGLRALLYVVPFFALASAFAVAALARRLFDSSAAGWWAGVFYALNPLVLWHGRNARPEVIAGFLVASGLALGIDALRARPWQQWPEAIAGSLCLLSAPFFHITAAYAVVPVAGLLLVLLAVRRRSDVLSFFVLAIPAGAIFVRQSTRVTDTYSLRRYGRLLLHHGEWVAAGVAAGILLLLLLRVAWRRYCGRRGPAPERPALARAGGLAAVALVALLVGIYLSQTPIPDRPRPTTRLYGYAGLTDLRVVVRLLSVPASLAGLLGVALLAGAGGATRRWRWAVLATLLPAAIAFGALHDFFMSRYMLVALVPLLALALAAILSSSSPRSHVLRLALGAGLVASLLAGRTHLAQTTEGKGLIRFMESFRREVTRADGVLLCDYSRAAAPFRRFWGVPTLGIDSGRTTDYRPAVSAALNAAGDRPLFMLTPFRSDGPESLGWEEVARATYAGALLRQERYQLPKTIRRIPVTWSLYRISPDHRGTTDLGQFPVFSRGFDEGSAGTAGLAPGARTSGGVQSGRDIRAGQEIPVLAAGDRSEVARMLVLVQQEEGTPPAVLAVRRGPESREATASYGLGGGWRLVLLDPPGQAAGDIAVVCTRGSCRVTDLLAPALGMKALRRIALDARTLQEKPGFVAQSRWTKAVSRVAVRAAGGPCVVLARVCGPRESDSPTEQRLSIGFGETAGAAPVPVKSGVWQWIGWQAEIPTSSESIAWLTAETAPTWAPGRPGAAGELGVLLQRLAVVSRDAIEYSGPTRAAP